MRRPSKELVDAVVVDHSRRTSVEPPTSAPPSAHIMIKEEPQDSPWKPLGDASRLRGVEGTESGSPLRQKLDRKEGANDTKPDRPRLNSGAAGRAIEKMIEETSTAKRKSLTSIGMLPLKDATDDSASGDKNDNQPREKMVEEDGDMAIFDFNESSPTASAPAKTDVRPKMSLASAVRAGRRHSSVPTIAPTDTENRRTEPSTRVNGGLPAIHKRTGSGAMKTDAPVSGLAKSTAVARSSMKERRLGGPPSSGSNSTRVGSGEQGVRESRSERTASRRKSMMV